ncbi:MAG TPA: DNA repair protein RadA, partial [Solirubrobacteraceae bacterium]|nr:DNA repair protein RadA [Solirubrobacteraceae bacterium]
MARPTTIHVCSSCGHSTPRWHGQCPGCGEWNTLVEETRSSAPSARAASARPSR